MTQSKKSNTYKVLGGQYAGLIVTVKKIPPMILSKVQSSSALPERPTYEATTSSGRVEIWPLDADGAEALGGRDKVRWDMYQEQLDTAMAEQNDRIIMAMFSFGTDCKLPDDGWEETFEDVGVKIPKNTNARRAFFLSTHLESEDITNLSKRIMEESGVSEEAINEAEAAFRGPVQDGAE